MSNFRDLNISSSVINGVLLTFCFTILCYSNPGFSAEPFQQDGSGLVAMEAEHFDANTPQGGHQWVVDTTSGFSGASAMEASPNIRTNHRSNYAANSPRLDFQVNFTSAGTHSVWVRGIGRGGGSNSLHVGLNGQEITTAAAISLTKDSGYVWSNGNHSLQIPSAGVHTINVWMREDGTIFDKLVLTTDSGFTPSGNGPAESPRGETGGNLSPILNSIGSKSVEEDQALSFMVSAS
ncbi:MAG: hypothetical protein GY807_12530, partial [Gammaproteobacteria bacterium]|nr:hypothetical protein [Gammaproteobacteria bacterium]